MKYVLLNQTCSSFDTCITTGSSLNGHFFATNRYPNWWCSAWNCNAGTVTAAAANEPYQMECEILVPIIRVAPRSCGRWFCKISTESNRQRPCSRRLWLSRFVDTACPKSLCNTNRLFARTMQRHISAVHVTGKRRNCKKCNLNLYRVTTRLFRYVPIIPTGCLLVMYRLRADS